MAKKLYVVELSNTLVVLADDWTDAQEIALDAQSTFDWPDIDITEMKHVWHPVGWDKSSFVYHGDHGDITFEQAIEITGIKPL